ncbi:GlcG/HbpS family heme-binding protein [Tunturiibacter gelidiferens]|uniref:GlcG/HbpS family heme-binding protein n=1 Tax=Tunturiibacter gelidiferens TaxID=3069689 RepID=UPI003D9B100A
MHTSSDLFRDFEDNIKFYRHSEWLAVWFTTGSIPLKKRRLPPKGAKVMQITTEQAERVLKASIQKARELGISVCIAILDPGGDLKTFHRMDGAWLGVIDVACE